jgi:hypothetical protein
MRYSLRLVLPALVLCSSFSAHAERTLIGDFWLIHHQGEMGENSLFVADGDAAHIIDRAGGIKSLGVYQVYEETGSELTAYDIEVDCAKNRVRINDAQDFDVLSRWHPKAFSKKWESKPDTWLALSRDFVCRPTERTALKMRSMGKFSAMELVDKSREIFPYISRDQYKAAVLKKIDEAFENMPAK